MEHGLDEIREIALDHLARSQSNAGENCGREQVKTALAGEETAKLTGQAALDLVRQSAHVIQVAEERGQALADQGQELAQRAVDQLVLAEARIRLLEEQVVRAEARARESEEWLLRIHDTFQRNLLDHPIPMLSSQAA